MSTHRKVVRSAGVIGGLTGVSRVLGFVRDMVIATAFGTGLGAEAFVVSFKIPNLLRDLVGEGATNAAFVPVLVECREKRPKEFWSLVSTLLSAMAVLLALISLAGVLLAPQVVSLIAPGFLEPGDPGKFELTVRLTRVIFPYIFLIGLSALAMGVLNALGEFTSSAFGPILLNVCMIAAGAFFERSYGPMALVLGVLAGGVMQLAWQLPPLWRYGFRFVKPGMAREDARKIGRLLVPRALGSALYQINVFVDSILASFERFVGAGGQSALYYSNRLFQLPLAIFGLSMAQAVLPTFSSQIARDDREGFKRTLSMSARAVISAALPAATGLVVLSRPIVRIIFQHGKFDAYSTRITSSALFVYGFGLLSCCFIKLLVNAFYAMQDTRTPLKTMALAVFLNVVLSLALMRPLGLGGLALASSVSATLNFLMLYLALRRRLGPPDEAAILSTLFRSLAACAVMAAATVLFDRYHLSGLTDASRLHQALALGLGIAGSVLIYFVASLLFGNEMARKILPWKKS